MDTATAGAIAGAFRLGALVRDPVYVTRGAMGEVWRFDTDAGAWAVKALFSWAEYAARPADVIVQLAALEAGISLPRPVVIEGLAVLEVEGLLHRAYEWVDLDDQLVAPVSHATAESAGGTLARIHALGLPWPPDGSLGLGAVGAADEPDIDRWYTEPPAPGVLADLAARAAAQSRPWGAELLGLLPLVDDLVDTVAGEHDPPIVCHRDFNLQNVVPRAGSGGLVVLDWENAGPLAADEELASALLDFCTRHGSIGRDVASAFLFAYAAAGGTAVLRGSESFAMTVHTALNFVRVLAGQALDDPPHRDFAEATLAGLLGAYLPGLAAAIPALVSTSP